MLRGSISVTDILLSFSNTLRIDYNISDVRELVEKSISQLENILHTKITSDLYTLQAENKYVSKEIDMLLQQITENLKSMSLLTCISMYDKQYGNNLKDVKYLGYSREVLMSYLKYLQDEELYKRRNEFFDAIVEGVNSIYNCPIKKFFIIMIILERLGIEEGVSIIANYIYLGGF